MIYDQEWFQYLVLTFLTLGCIYFPIQTIDLLRWWNGYTTDTDDGLLK